MKSFLYTFFLLTALSFTIYKQANAQAYNPMAKEGAQWIVKEIGFYSSQIKKLWEYKCEGDTLIAGNTYKKIWKRWLSVTNDPPPFYATSHYSLYGFLRDDIVNRKVYGMAANPSTVISPQCQRDPDIMLYDFSQNVGNTAAFCLLPINDDVIESIDYENHFNQTTKTFKLQNSEYEYYEGLGSQFGLFELMEIPHMLEANGFTELYYYCEDGNCIYIEEFVYLTIGEVFDFEVGDEFHYKLGRPGFPPTGDRITITNKFFSEDSNSVTYFRQHNYYNSFLNYSGGAPFLDFYFKIYDDSITYNNLNRPIYAYDYNFRFQSYYDNRCDSLTNGYGFSDGPGFEDSFYQREYGKGLGRIKNFWNDGGGQVIQYDEYLRFYRRGGVICGTPDLTAVENVDLPGIKIYPNPADRILNLEFESQSCTYTIYSSMGAVISKGVAQKGVSQINVEHLAKGVYMLQVVMDSKVIVKKFLKE